MSPRTTFVSISIGVAILVAVGGTLWQRSALPEPRVTSQKQAEMKFTYMTGFFKHDQLPTGPDQGFRAHTLPEFGILTRNYGSHIEDTANLTQWQLFERYLLHLNADSGESQYKVLLVGRHGEGVHNVKEHDVGRQEWERYWSKFEGDGTLTWLDARLTNKGEQQARELGDFWTSAIQGAKMPLPHKYYSSPLTRCLQTASLTFDTVSVLGDRVPQLEVKEALREINGVHTCDKRSSRSKIEAAFPNAVLDPGFTEEDELWQPDRRETLEERVPLMHDFLVELFRSKDATVVSLTSHSGAIRALYLAIGHPDVWVAAGAVVPIVVCMERKQ